MTGLKKALQWLLMAVAGLASFYVAMQWMRPSPSEPQNIVEAVTRASRPASAAASVAPMATVKDAASQERDATLALPQRAGVAPDSKGDAFAALNWLPPPPPVRVAPPAPPPPPPAPVAPPLPFTYVGLLEKGAAKPQAFISKGDSLLVVSAGDLLDNNTYRVDTLTAQQIVITYLPLNTPQTLNLLGTTK
jgi:hypothetical protein